MCYRWGYGKSGVQYVFMIGVTSAREKGWGENEGAEIGAEERVVFE